jgi:hypothetical protein
MKEIGKKKGVLYIVVGKKGFEVIIPERMRYPRGFH